VVLVAGVEVGQVNGEFAANVCIVDALFFMSALFGRSLILSSTG